jgi:hypothetical protein
MTCARATQTAATYEYRIEMRGAAGASRTVVREHASEFEAGECWGYNRFCKIADLAAEGYLDESAPGAPPRPPPPHAARGWRTPGAG